MLDRRCFLAGGLAMMAGMAAGPVEAALRPHQSRFLSLANLHTGERVKAVYWADGWYLPDALHAFNRLLRDHRTDDIHPISPKLLDLLVALQAKLGSDRPFEIISGYRSPKTNSMLAAAGEGVAVRSLHLDGKAVDIRARGISTVHLGRAARSLRAGGVGTYSRSGFVHVDVGRVRTW